MNPPVAVQTSWKCRDNVDLSDSTHSTSVTYKSAVEIFKLKKIFKSAEKIEQKKV